MTTHNETKKDTPKPTETVQPLTFNLGDILKEALSKKVNTNAR